MGFWKDQPGPTMVNFFKDLISNGEPRILRKGPPAFIEKPKNLADINFRLVEQRNENEYREFLRDNFNIAPHSYFELPLWDNRWIGIEARKGATLVGTIFNIPIALPGLPNSGIMDYFCIIPEFRKMGIGSRLLYEIDLATSGIGRFSHIFMKEGTPLWWLPALETGTWVYRQRDPFRSIKTYENKKIKIVDSHYRSLPLGEKIGELVILDPTVTQNEINEICDASNYKTVLALKDQCPKWSVDSRYSWYAFNWTPGSAEGWYKFRARNWI
jgi:hypothetical protein